MGSCARRRLISACIAVAGIAAAATGCRGSEADPTPAPTPTPAPAATSTAKATFDPTAVATLKQSAGDLPRRDTPYTYAALPVGYRVESITGGLEQPAAFDGAADGRIFVAEQFAGRVRVITPDGTLQPQPFYVVPDLHIEAERGFVSELGLVGLTVEPDAKPLSLLLYYSSKSTQGVRKTKLVRVREENGRAIERETLLEVPYAPACCHIGGALTWLPDGTLLVGVGDHEKGSEAQNLKSPVGKVLRITRVGLAAPDNPFVGRQDADPRVFAYGLRNPFGVAADPIGKKYVLDNGEIGFDTVYELKPAGNYGWPASARAATARVEEPLQLYQESLGMASAVVYRGKLAAFEGDLFFCQFHRGGALHWFPISDDPVEVDRILLGGCSSGLRVLPDGSLYYLDYFDGALYRIVGP